MGIRLLTLTLLVGLWPARAWSAPEKAPESYDYVPQIHAGLKTPGVIRELDVLIQNIARPDMGNRAQIMDFLQRRASSPMPSIAQAASMTLNSMRHPSALKVVSQALKQASFTGTAAQLETLAHKTEAGPSFDGAAPTNNPADSPKLK